MTWAHRISIFFLAVSLLFAQQNIISTIAGGTPPLTPTAAVGASIGDPARVAVDSTGNFYFASVHSVFRVDRNGTLTRVAGNGRYGYTGDGGPATSAQLEYPTGIAVDTAGNVYVADRDAQVIRRIAAGNGLISTVAGTGTPGYAGDGGPAAGAQLNGPMGLAADVMGNLYIADTGNHSIRKISVNGSIATIAGNGSPGYSGDGSLATLAQLNTPEGVAVDAGGNLYIADTINNRIRRVDLSGNIATVAGTGSSSIIADPYSGTGIANMSGDGGPANKAPVVFPTDVTVDSAGNLYIADFGNCRIRTVSNGVIQTIAGSVDGIPPVDGQAALSARFNGPTGVAVDAGGTVYFAEGSIGTGSGLANGDFVVWKISTAGILNIAAGNGEESFSGDGGTAAFAQLHAPVGMALDSAGDLYIADSLNQRVREIAASGLIVTQAGNALAGYSGDGGAGVNAQLNAPRGVAVDGFGNFYISDTANNRIRKVSANGGIYTLAGNGNASFFGDGGLAVLASIHAPGGIAIDSSGTVWIADTLNQRIRKVTPDGKITTVAGNGTPGFSGDGGPAANAALNLPASLALDSADNLYIADTGNNRIRMVSQAGTITTIAGNGNAGFYGDGGAATGAQLNAPQGVAVDGAGNVYVADTGNHRLRRFSAGGAIVTIAGNGNCCYAGDGGPASAAALNAPAGVVVDASGNIYLADSANNSVQVIEPSAALPAITTIANGASDAAGPVAPSEVVVVFGVGLGPAQLTQNQGAALGTQLGGVSVMFNGVAGQMLYASGTQVSAIVPSSVSGPSVQVVVQHGFLSTPPMSEPLVPAAPALFTLSGAGSGQAAAVNPDGSANSAAHPVAEGSTITLFATGMGAAPASAASVVIGGVMESAVAAPTPTPGVVQVSASVPQGIPAGGAVPVTLQIGSVVSPAGVTIAVH